VVLGGGPATAGPLASATLSILLTNQTFVYPALGATGTAVSPVAATLAPGSAFNGSQTVILTGTAAIQSPVDRIGPSSRTTARAPSGVRRLPRSAGPRASSVTPT
jgi:hypothetical protein